MTPLDAARALTDHRLICGCGSGSYPTPFPVKMLPKIVAALEAAEAVIANSNPGLGETGYVYMLRRALGEPNICKDCGKEYPPWAVAAIRKIEEYEYGRCFDCIQAFKNRMGAP